MTACDRARRWVAERYERAAEKCALENCNGNLAPCPGHVADAILDTGWVPLADVLAALRDDQAFAAWAARHGHAGRWMTGRPIIGDYLTDQLATKEQP